MSTDPILAPFVSRDAAAGIIYVDVRGFFRTHVGQDLLKYMVAEGYLEKWHVRALFGYEHCVFAVFFMSSAKRGPYALRSRAETGVTLVFKEAYKYWEDEEKPYKEKYPPPDPANYHYDIQHMPKRRKVESE